MLKFNTDMNKKELWCQVNGNKCFIASKKNYFAI